MISFYNETQSPWRVTIVGRVLMLEKKKTFKINNDKEKSYRSKILINPSVFENKQELEGIQLINHINEKLRKYVSNQNSYGYLKSLNKKATSNNFPLFNMVTNDSCLLFNRKNLKPFISGNTKISKNFLLISIRLNGRHITNISNKNFYILDYYIGSDELTFIAVANTVDAKLSITCVDKNNKVMTKYQFTQNEGNTKKPFNVFVSTEYDIEESILNSEEVTKNIKINKFIPSRPTYLIFIEDEKDLQSLEKVVNTKDHLVLLFSPEQLENIISKGYRAVTLYSPSGKPNSDILEEVKKKIGIIYSLDSNNNVKKRLS